MILNSGKQRWHPIAASTDLVPRHVFHAQLLARELAVWRADDGHVNVWENRCLHRGVRLSIGINDGRELVCQYHGWRYANRTAGCTYIPAHPADAPARTICNNHYPVREDNGLIWSCDTQQIPDFPEHDFLPGEQLVLRAMPVNATLEVIAEQLTELVKGGLCGPAGKNSTLLTQDDDFTLSCDLDTELGQNKISFFLQPVDSHRTVVRGIVSGLPAHMHADNQTSLTLLRNYNHRLNQLRTGAEQQMQHRVTPAPWEVELRPVSATLAGMPQISPNSQSLLRMVVRDIQPIATDIKSIVLEPLEDQLPTFQPGAHIDVHLPNGLVRQYSLANAPGQTDRFVIGVKQETESTGGSAYIHTALKTGDLLAISPPRNNFQLRRDAVQTQLIAGGIGIVPMLCMAQALHHSELAFQLHYFVQAEDHIAFSSTLEHLQPNVNIYTALDPVQTQTKLQALLASYQTAHHVYFCGPVPMLDAAREIAHSNSWPDEAVHFEYFKNTQARDDSIPFKVSLARSGLTLDVPAGRSLLDVLRENNIDLPSSCEQGACGTCQVTVLDGQPLHQDVYLSQREQQSGRCMMTCVSRAQSDSLTLDI